MVSGRSSENATSSVVSSEPSWNLTPLRSVNSQVSGSGLRHVASTGIDRPRSSTCSSDSKTWCATVRLGCAATKWGSKVVTSAERPMRSSAAGAAAARSSSARAARPRPLARAKLMGKRPLVGARVVGDAPPRRPQIVLVVERQYAEIADADLGGLDRKSTRLNSSHLVISYAVFCLRKKE